MIRRSLISGMSLLALAGCSITSPRDTGNAHRVLLEPVATEQSCHRHVGGSLIVAYPEAPDTLNTSRIALIQDGKWDYFAGMRWADFLPGNVQSALIGSFSASGRFDSVLSDDTVAHSRLRLSSEIRKFEARYDSAKALPDAELQIMFTLRETGRADALKQFLAGSTVKASANTAAAIDAAFGQAFAETQRTALRKIYGCKP